MGSVRREFLDHILILSEGHARRLAKEYVLYFNYARPHQGLDGQIPFGILDAIRGLLCTSDSHFEWASS